MQERVGQDVGSFRCQNAPTAGRVLSKLVNVTDARGKERHARVVEGRHLAQRSLAAANLAEKRPTLRETYVVCELYSSPYEVYCHVESYVLDLKL